jgi:GT2 family glycosyltransferase
VVVASVVVVTFNNLVYTRLCLESLLANTDGPGYEVLVVDNGSDDDTGRYLTELARHHPHVRPVLLGRNLGFAAANNRGLSRARGDVLVLLNNDTVVPRGWLAGLSGHLRDGSVGLVGPVTNRAGNEAEVAAPYGTYAGFARFARRRAGAHAGARFDVPTLTMFCLAMRRDAFARLGPLDERFGVGLFEDDDYSMRARAAGYRVACAEDVFVHHFGQASIGKLARTGAYGELFHANRRKWEEKWGTAWEPHRRRPNPGYRHMVRRIRAVVRASLPRDAAVIVVSRGDGELLRLGGRPAYHYPQGADGAYAGHHPADSAEAIRLLERLRGSGGRAFLLVPETERWWLRHYRGLHEHLQSLYQVAVRRENTCVIFAL